MFLKVNVLIHLPQKYASLSTSLIHNKISNNHLLGDVLGGQHSGVGRGLVSVGLHLHSSGDPTDGLTARQVGHVDEGVVEGGVDVSHTEHHLSILHLQILRNENPCC